MRLLFVTPYLPPYAVGGAELSTLALAHALRDRGHDIHILTLRLGDDPTEAHVPVEQVDVGVRLLESGRPLPARVFERPDVQWHVARTVARLAVNFDLVHCQTLHLLPAAFAGARRARVPLFATIRDLMGVCSVGTCLLEHDRVPADCGLLKLQRECFPDFGRLYNARRDARGAIGVGVRFLTARGRSALLRRCDRILTVSAELGRLYEDAGLVRPGTVRVLHNIAATKPRKRVFGTRDIAVYAGKVSHGKGVGFLLEALDLVHRQAPDLQLVIAGYADEAWRSRLAQASLDYRGSVPHAELLPLYDRARLAIVPSIWPEPLPRAALEAAAAGVPVVATTTGGSPEVVIDGRTGLLVPPRDAEALAEAVIRLWRDEELGHVFGIAAQTHVGSVFSAATVAAHAEALYADVIHMPRAAGGARTVSSLNGL